MKRTPLHTACVAATISTLLALSLAEPALAHVNVQPRLVEQGKATKLRVELPQLQAGAPPVRLEVDGDGVTVLSSNLEGIGGFSGAETIWNVRVRVSPAVPPGDLLLVLRALFADGKSVEVDGTITVVPPAEKASTAAFPWLWVVVGVTVAVGLAAAVLLLARRRRSAC